MGCKVKQPNDIPTKTDKLADIDNQKEDMPTPEKEVPPKRDEELSELEELDEESDLDVDLGEVI